NPRWRARAMTLSRRDCSAMVAPMVGCEWESARGSRGILHSICGTKPPRGLFDLVRGSAEDYRLTMSTTSPQPQTRDENTRFCGQPWARLRVVGVGMCERFSFDGMQGILLIYLYYSVTEGGPGIPKAVAGGIVGAYGGAVYLSTILGAWIADRLF